MVQPRSVVRMKLKAWLKEHPNHPMAKTVEVSLAEIEVELEKIAEKRQAESSHVEAPEMNFYGALHLQSACVSVSPPLRLSGAVPIDECVAGPSPASTSYFMEPDADVCMLEAAPSPPATPHYDRAACVARCAAEPGGQTDVASV